MVTNLNYLNNNLSKYGLTSSGNIQNDLAALRKAKQAKGESTLDVDNFTAMIKKIGQNSKTTKMKPTEGTIQGQELQGPPWVSLMQSLGLDIQGSKEADFTAIQAKITQLESSTSLTAEQKATLASLKAQFENIKKMEANKPQGPQDKQKVGQDGQQPQRTSQGEPPWFSMMKSLGLQPQGSPQADFAAIKSKINQMKVTTLPANQKANLESLQAQLEQYELQAQ